MKKLYELAKQEQQANIDKIVKPLLKGEMTDEEKCIFMIALGMKFKGSQNLDMIAACLAIMLAEGQMKNETMSAKECNI